MNWLDRTIAWISPRAGMQRVRARMALEAGAALLRGYEGAKVGRRTSGWMAAGSSANAEIQSSGSMLRNRVRQLARDDPYARRAIRALVANLIGTGITADSTSQAGKVWKEWEKEADFYGELGFCGLQALIAQCWFESGETLIVRHRLTAAEAANTKSGVPLQIKVLEPDFLDFTKHGPQGNGNVCYGGVEVDKMGRRVAYWLYDAHPGDAPIFSAALKSRRYPAADVIHLFKKERPGQLRGVPQLHAVVLQLRDRNEYNEALLVKKKIESCFAAFITTDDQNRGLGSATQASLESGGAARDGAGNRLETLVPGLINYLKPGETVEFANPSSTAGSSQFETDQLRAIAVGADLTYEILSGDLSRVNFSSMRAGRQEFKTLIEQMRWLTFIPTVCCRVQDWFEEAAFLVGRTRTVGYDFVWTPPRWEYVNPLDDVKTDKEELAAGLATWPELIRKRGEDPEKVLQEIEEFAPRLKALGISITGAVQTSAQPAAAPAAEPAEPAEPADGAMDLEDPEDPEDPEDSSAASPPSAD